MENVLNFIQSLDLKSEPIVVACSGGADSMFLIDLLNSMGFQIICAHINHKIRKESDSEFAFVENYCKNHDIIFEGTELIGYKTGNFEHFARTFRYSFFERVLKKYNSKYLFTAHHGDDLIETVMMRILRGSTLRGYHGFSILTQRGDYVIVRPLIFLTKSNIESMAHAKALEYVVDSSNFSDKYTRNRFRHRILPLLKEEDSAIHEKFLLFSNELLLADEYINKNISKCLKESYNERILDITKYNRYDDYIKKRLLSEILRELYPDNLYLIGNNHIVELQKIIQSEKKNIQITLPNALIVRKEYNKMKFGIFDNYATSFNYELTDDLVINGYKFRFGETDNESNFVIRLNSSQIKMPLRVRTRKNCDKMQVKNLNGSKKINDIFIDNKIVLEKRNSWPIVVDANDTILWLPGLKKSEFDIAKKSNYDIIVEYLKEGDEKL